MERRKIQKTGGSSFTVTLPKKWIQNNKLKDGDSVSINYQKSGLLYIQPSSKKDNKPKKILKIDSEEKDLERIKREIISLFILGIEEIELQGDKIPKEFRLILRKTLQMLVGFEVVEDFDNKIVLKNLLSSSNFSIDQGIKTMMAMTMSMFKDAVEAFIENNNDLAQDVIERDFEVDKIYFLILRKNYTLLQGRISEEEAGASREKVYYFENIATQIERIADHAVKISQLTLDQDEKINMNFLKSYKQISKKIIEVLEESAYFSLKVDLPKAHETMNTVTDLQVKINSLYKKLTKDDFGENYIACDSLTRVIGYCSNMAEDTIDRALLDS